MSFGLPNGISPAWWYVLAEFQGSGFFPAECYEPRPDTTSRHAPMQGPMTDDAQEFADQVTVKWFDIRMTRGDEQKLAALIAAELRAGGWARRKDPRNWFADAASLAQRANPDVKIGHTE